MKPKIIKSEVDYKMTLARIEEIFDAEQGTEHGDELELLSKLVEEYEDQECPFDIPSPVEAIKFRMEQQGLKHKDLIPFIGSASKVSEVLCGRRELSKAMIRKLREGLAIPADVLLQDCNANSRKYGNEAASSLYPITEMANRGWFDNFSSEGRLTKIQKKLLHEEFTSRYSADLPVAMLNRQQVRLGAVFDKYALHAWQARVASLANKEALPVEYQAGTVTGKFLKDLAQLSYLNDGPLLAKEYLNKNGIHLIIERHLPKTHLDGAAIKLKNGGFVVALTLRHDRLDNFWFTLFHELAHVALHFEDDNTTAFFDDMESAKKHRCEREADDYARDALIPQSKWEKARLNLRSDHSMIVSFARRLRIHPAIPAGRIRHDRKNFSKFTPLVGYGEVRPMFGVS